MEKVQGYFDMDFGLDDDGDPFAEPQPAPVLTFTVNQMEAMLQAARAQQAMALVAALGCNMAMQGLP